MTKSKIIKGGRVNGEPVFVTDPEAAQEYKMGLVRAGRSDVRVIGDYDSATRTQEYFLNKGSEGRFRS